MARPYTILDCEQGSPEWAALRLGRATSSAADCVISLAELFGEKGRDNEKSRNGYALRLANERLTGVPSDDSFTTGAMERGHALEPQALLAYMEAHPGDDVRRVGFVSGNDGTWGDSPDAWVYSALGVPVGACEVKNPYADTHQNYVNEIRRSRAIPRDYVRQCVHHLWAAVELEYVDFVSCHPLLYANNYAEVRLYRDDAKILLDRYGQAMIRFEQLVVAQVAWLRAGVDPAPKESA